MDFGSLLLSLALLLLVAFLVARPLLEQRGTPEKESGPADQLLAQRDSLLVALRDLDFDHATGKISDDDYTPQRAQLVAEGVAVLKQLDALRPATLEPAQSAEDALERAIAARRRSLAEEGARPAPRTAQSADDLLEAAVAGQRTATAGRDVEASIESQVKARRKPASAPQPAAASGKVTCPNCGTPAQPGDRFCPKCGHTLALACPECGRPVQPTDRFCAACGANLQPAQTPG
jgi:double zinc ribbon protein